MSSRFSRRLPNIPIALLALLVVAAGALVAPPSAAASAPTSYAALGDSYSAGVGAGGRDPAGDSCHRNPAGFPGLWAADHQPVTLAFPACAGATTVSLLAGQLGALNSATSLITVTIGGNDVGFAPAVTTCQVASAPACSAVVDVAKALIRTTLQVELTATYAMIRHRAPNARLVVLGYPRLFETTATCGSHGMRRANRVTLNQGADALNSAIRNRATALGATYVDVSARFAGHGICGSSPWINGPTSNTSDAYHPNAAGYRDGYLPALESATDL